ncbi:hypothetical protein D3C80_1281100 [compost metagenome]
MIEVFAPGHYPVAAIVPRPEYVRRASGLQFGEPGLVIVISLDGFIEVEVANQVGGYVIREFAEWSGHDGSLVLLF